MSHLLCYLAGAFTVLAFLAAIPAWLAFEEWRWERDQAKGRPKPGEWVIYSCTGAGKDRRYTIWRHGTASSRVSLPAMKTEAEAVKECARRNGT